MRPQSTIRTLRITAGLRQAQLANMLDISQAMVSFIENQKRKPTSEIKEKLANFFNIDINGLFPE